MFFNLVFGLLRLLFTTAFLRHCWLTSIVRLLRFHLTPLCGGSFSFLVGSTFIVVATSRSVKALQGLGMLSVSVEL